MTICKTLTINGQKCNNLKVYMSYTCQYNLNVVQHHNQSHTHVSMWYQKRCFTQWLVCQCVQCNMMQINWNDYNNNNNQDISTSDIHSFTITQKMIDNSPQTEASKLAKHYQNYQKGTITTPIIRYIHEPGASIPIAVSYTHLTLPTILRV